MIIAFLDLLGFSWLIENNLTAAYDNLNTFNRIIRTKIIDDKTRPIDSYDTENGLRDFVQNAAVSSFNNMISISDSLIIGAEDTDLFVKQLSNLVAAAFIEYSESFRVPFTDLAFVKNNKIYDVNSKLEYQPHMAFPILFRGGVSVGEDVIFNKEGQIFQNEYKIDGLNVCGLSYVEAVRLERSGKGPRLFCHKKFVDKLKNERHAIRQVESDIFEIVWTYYACEATSCSVSHKMENIYNRIDDKLLIRAVNLYNYYYNNQDKSKERDRQEYRHYEEFILLICRGLIKYAYDNNLDIDLTCCKINEKLDCLEGWDYSVSEKEIDCFI